MTLSDIEGDGYNGGDGDGDGNGDGDGVERTVLCIGVESHIN